MRRINVTRDTLNKAIYEGVAEVLGAKNQGQQSERSLFDEKISNISYIAERLEVFAQTIKEDYIPAIESKYQDGIEAINNVLGNGAYSLISTDSYSDTEIHVTFKINSFDGFKKHIQGGNYKSVRYAVEDTANEEGIEEVTRENYQMLLDKTLSDSFMLAELLGDVLNENLYDNGRGPVSASFYTSSDDGTCRLEIEVPFNMEELESFINGRE